MVSGLEDDAPAARAGSWRWALMGGLALLAATSAVLATRTGGESAAPSSPAVPRIDAHRAAELPLADLGWVQMRDHFTVTIGPQAGQGAAHGDLLVVADTTLAPGASFPVHRHRGIDVVTVVIDGMLALEEGGRAEAVDAGNVHVVSTGAGILHAEANHGERPARFVQLWLASRSPDRPPASEQIGPEAPADAPLPLSLTAPDVQVRRALLEPGASTSWTVARDRSAYVVNAGGDLDLDTIRLTDGDGALLTDGRFVATATGDRSTQVIVVDVPAPAAR